MNVHERGWDIALHHCEVLGCSGNRTLLSESIEARLGGAPSSPASMMQTQTNILVWVENFSFSEHNDVQLWEEATLERLRALKRMNINSANHA